MIPVLKRMKIQLQKSLIKTKYTENLDLTWAFKNIKPINKSTYRWKVYCNISI